MTSTLKTKETISPFRVQATCPGTKARRGVLYTRHGAINTPVFMPVGTAGTVKAARDFGIDLHVVIATRARAIHQVCDARNCQGRERSQVDWHTE